MWFIQIFFFETDTGMIGFPPGELTGKVWCSVSKETEFAEGIK